MRRFPLSTRQVSVISFSNEFLAVLEVGRQPDGALEGDLLAAAYQVSRKAPVLLVLDHVSRAEVDKALDHVVSTSEFDRPGVRYADAEDDATVLAAAKKARWVFASSDRFRAKLAARGLRYDDPDNFYSDLSTLIA